MCSRCRERHDSLLSSEMESEAKRNTQSYVRSLRGSHTSLCAEQWYGVHTASGRKARQKRRIRELAMRAPATAAKSSSGVDLCRGIVLYWGIAWLVD